MTERETGFPLAIVDADWMPDDEVLIVSGDIRVEPDLTGIESHDEDGVRVIARARLVHMGLRVEVTEDTR